MAAKEGELGIVAIWGINLPPQPSMRCKLKEAVVTDSREWGAPGFIAYAIIPMANAVQERDRNQCFVTGASLQGDTDLVCMFPPFFWRLYLCSPLRGSGKRTPEFFETASNAAFLHKDLTLFFLDSTFSVDVDDHHRVLVFRDMGPTQKLLPSHLQVTANERTFSDLSQSKHSRFR
ncbi:hypothetical protein F5146DRAFT_1000230 [Armillaria mellea]|nr:hypothetical protein F5146DRAFT_1000230 [Armillaria mellea]